MSVNGMKPNFRNKEEYKQWRSSWATVYRELSKRIQARKLEVKKLQRNASGKCPCCLQERSEIPCPAGNDSNHEEAVISAKAHKELTLMQRDGTKMMTLMEEAKKRRDRIHSMRQQIEEQPFPLEMDADRVDFHFNKGHLEFNVLPMWVLKTKGLSFYVDHIDAEIPWSTRELDKGSTLGMIRFRKCRISITKDRVATLRPLAA